MGADTVNAWGPGGGECLWSLRPPLAKERRGTGHPALVALLSLSATHSFSQTKNTKTASNMVYKTGNPADWPKESAVIAAPRNHKILLENDNVRVLDVTIAPGETEPVHFHRWPSVLYILSAGDFIDRDG